MSKNGYLLFRNYDPYITSNFGYRIHPITKVNTLHTGVDYGTNNNKLPTYSIESGVVVKTGFSKTQGNYVYVKYPRLGKNALYQHLDKINVKNNQKVDLNTIIGYVGATGEVTGIHLHFGWFNSAEQDKGWYERNWENFEKYEYIKALEYLGTPVERNEKVDQIEVVINNLCVRKLANGEILGYINPGIYNIIEKEEKGEYTWYKVGYNMWIAYSNEFANLYLKSEDEIILDSKNIANNDLYVDYESVNNQDDIIIDSENLILDDTIDEEIVDKIFKKNFFNRIFNSFMEFIKKILKIFKVL